MRPNHFALLECAYHSNIHSGALLQSHWMRAGTVENPCRKGCFGASPCSVFTAIVCSVEDWSLAQNSLWTWAILNSPC